jgi:hypothetical protein
MALSVTQLRPGKKTAGKKTIVDGLSMQTVARDVNSLLRSLSIPLEDEGWHNNAKKHAAQ